MDDDLRMSELSPSAGSPLLRRARRNVRLFAVPAGAQRFRRPTDIVLLVATGTIALAVGMVADQPPSGLQQGIMQVFASLPTLLDPLWQVSIDAAVVYAGFLLIISAVRKHWGLLRDGVTVLLAVIVITAIVGRMATGSWPDLLGGLVHDDPPIDFPSLGLAWVVAVIGVASPHVSRPFRWFGRIVVSLGLVGTVALAFALPWHALGSVSIGWAAAAAVHLLFGSPGGLPSLAAVRGDLQAIGLVAEPLDVEANRGVVHVRAKAPDGSDLDVKVFGRDAWDGQLLVSFWRFLWYRDGGSTLALSRLQQVEHEAFLALLAERRGAVVAPVIAAGVGASDDALIVARRVGLGLAAVGDDLTDRDLDRAWESLASLHAAGITHGALDPENVRVTPDAVLLADLSSAEVSPERQQVAIDRAQMLVSQAVAAGQPRAIDAARRMLDDAGLEEVTSYLQTAALNGELRRQLKATELDIDDIRKATMQAAGVKDTDLQRLRRLTLGRVLMGVLLFVAFSALISSITDIGFDVIVDSIAAASVPIIIVAFFLGQAPRIAGAAPVSIASPTPIPYGRLVALQFTICFVNLAMPSTAGRVAVNVRFFQRNGVGSTAAVTIGALDSITGFIAQMLLIVSILLFGLGSLDIKPGQDVPFSKIARLILLLGIAAVIAIVVVLVVPRFRLAVKGLLAKGWEQVGPLLRSPRRITLMVAANLLTELLFALCIYTVLLAFDQHVSYIDVVLVNELVALFAGLMPVPGGIGVTEAALTAGFIAIGVDEASAFAAAITYRVITFYLPPVMGVVAMRWLQRQRFL